MISTETPAGSRGVTRSRLALAASITATVLAPDWRRTSSTTVGTPFRRANERCSLVPSSARPMSRTRIGEPLRVAITRSLNCEASAKRPIVRSVRSLTSVVTLPPGRSAFCCCSALRTSAIESW